MNMNPNLNRLNDRAFPLSDVLHLPSGASKNEQGAPHRLPGEVKNWQGFLHASGRTRVKKLVHDHRIRVAS